MIYETRCLINGKTYVGKHQTRDVNDGYTGSGNLLKRAIAKHGAENFVTRVLYDFDVEWKMNLAEKILVCTDPEVSYNLCPGGEGGWGYVNSNGLGAKHGASILRRLNQDSDRQRKKAKLGAAVTNARYGPSNKLLSYWKGKHHSEMTKEKMRANHSTKSHPRGPRGPYKKRLWSQQTAISHKDRRVGAAPT